MRVCKVELFFVDFDNVGDDVKTTLENARYPNRCINPHVLSVDWREIGEWADENPLNNSGTYKDEITRLFKE